MRKKLLLIQPGAFGDIFACAPIAKWYADKGYKVYWPVTEKFLPTIKYFNYVVPIVLDDEALHEDWLRSDVMKIIPMMEEYDKVINLADRGPHPTAQHPNENFELCKYRLAQVPFEEKNKLVFSRNKIKEQELFEKMVGEHKDYAVVHRIASSGEVTPIPPHISLPIVEVTVVPNYNIQDWFSIFLNAKEIYCIESSVHQFLDGVVKHLTPNRYLLRRSVSPEDERFTVSTQWKLDYIGKNSRITG
jgi:hypothetical protein